MNYYKATEKFLYNYNSLKASIENMKQEIEEIEYLGMSAINYDHEITGKTFAFHSLTESEAMRAADRKQMLQQRIEILESKIERIDRAIEALNKTEQKIINLRYKEGRQWWEIAYEMRYSEKWCKELRKRAVNKIAVGLFGEDALPKDFPFTSLHNEKDVL